MMLQTVMMAVSAQSRQVSGTVPDAKDGEPVIGATIMNSLF